MVFVYICCVLDVEWGMHYQTICCLTSTMLKVIG